MFMVVLFFFCLGSSLAYIYDFVYISFTFNDYKVECINQKYYLLIICFGICGTLINMYMIYKLLRKKFNLNNFNLIVIIFIIQSFVIFSNSLVSIFILNTFHSDSDTVDVICNNYWLSTTYNVIFYIIRTISCFSFGVIILVYMFIVSIVLSGRCFWYDDRNDGYNFV